MNNFDYNTELICSEKYFKYLMKLYKKCNLKNRAINYANIVFYYI